MEKVDYVTFSFASSLCIKEMSTDQLATISSLAVQQHICGSQEIPMRGLAMFLYLFILTALVMFSNVASLFPEKNRTVIEQLSLEEEFAKDIAQMITESTLESNCEGNVFITSRGCSDFLDYMLVQLSEWAPPVLLVTFQEYKKIRSTEVWTTFLAWEKRPCSIVFVCDLLRSMEGIDDSLGNMYSDDEEEIGHLQFSKFIESSDQVLYLSDFPYDYFMSNNGSSDNQMIIRNENQEKILKQSGILVQLSVEKFAEPEALLRAYSNCKYCGPSSKWHQRDLGTWQRNKTQFGRFFRVFKDFHKLSFNKTNLNIGYFNHPPHFSCYTEASFNFEADPGNEAIEVQQEGAYSCQGVEWEMISQMEASLDFTATWINLSNPTVGYLGETSNISNMITSFEAEKIDLAVGGISVTPKRTLYVDFSSVFANDPVVFVVQKKRDSFALGIWLAFNPEVWPLILLLIAIISFLFHIIIYQYTLERPKKHRAGKWALSAYLRRHHYEGRRKPVHVTMFEALEITLQPLVGQPLSATQITHRPRRLLKILLAIWWFSCLIITTLYNTSLITSLINPVSPKEPEALQDLLDFGYNFKPAGKQGAFFELVRSVIDSLPSEEEGEEYLDPHPASEEERVTVGLIKQISDRLILDGSRSRSLVAFVIEESAVKRIKWDKKEIGFSQIKVIRERLFLTTYAWPTQRHAPFKEKIDIALGRLNSAGLVEYWYQQFIGKRDIKSGSQFRLREKLGQINLNMQVLQGAFIFLVFGYGFGALVLGVEQLTKRYRFRFFTKKEIVGFSKAVFRSMRKVYSKHLAAEDEELQLRRKKNKMRFRGAVRTVTTFKRKENVIPFMK